MSDTHNADFEKLLGGYQWPLAAWSTKDLVKLANIIDIELQQRADETFTHDDDIYRNYMEEQY